MSVISIITKCLGVYFLTLCLVGTLGNMLTIYLVFRTSLKETTTFLFLAFLAFTDTASLYFFNLDHFLMAFGIYNRQNASTRSCSTNVYLHYNFLQSAAFILVTLSFDRFLFVRIANWNKSYLPPRRAIFVGFGVIAFFFLFNLNILFTFGVEYTLNGTTVIQCFYSPRVPESIWISYWRTVSAIVYSLIPFILLSIASALLIYELNKRTSNLQISRHRQDNQRALNKTVLTEAILFVLMTMPTAVVTSFLNSYLQTSGEIGKLVILICNAITFSYHAYNFLIIFWTNKRFSKELKKFFSIKNASNEPSNLTNTARKTRTT